MTKVIAAVLGLFLAGCVERTLLIRSDPPEAEVWLDGKPVGKTPLQLKFEWYGDREIQLRKDGFEPMKQVESVSPPWWQVTPIDFVTDVLIPFTLHDRREFDYMLQPETSKETLENVQKRAIELREKLNKDK